MHIAEAKTQMFKDIEVIDQLMLEEEKRNAALKRRMLWLIPFNFAMIWGTLRYSMNIQNIGRKWWPKQAKVRVGNLFMIATI